MRGIWFGEKSAGFGGPEVRGLDFSGKGCSFRCYGRRIELRVEGSELRVDA